MPSLLLLAEARALIQTDISDTGLQLLIDAAEQEIVQRHGPNYPGDITYTMQRLDYTLEVQARIFLERQIESITSVTEFYGDEMGELTSVLATNDYRQEFQGYALERLGNGTNQRWVWGHRVVVVYKPKDDTARRKAAISELVRLAVRHSGVKSQSIGGAVSETSFDDYIMERQAIVEALHTGSWFS